MASTPLMKEPPSRSTPVFRPAAPPRRTPSFSSSSRSNSWGSSFESPPFSLDEESPPFSPLKLTGVPFSWEQTPGIPKNHHFFRPKQPSGRRLLPLPPAGATTSAAEKLQASKRDPFFAALLECSKDDLDHDHDRDRDQDHDHGFKISTRSFSDRFGFINMYSSCKRTCSVSESIVYLPRPSPHYLLSRHRRRSS